MDKFGLKDEDKAILVNDLVGYNQIQYEDNEESSRREGLFKARITQSTNLYMSWLLLLVFIYTVSFSQNSSVATLITALLALISLSLIVLNGIKSYRLSYKSKNDCFEEIKLGTEGLYLVGLYLYIRPFKYRYVWWWILITGIILVNIQHRHDFSSVNIKQNIDVESFSSYISDIMRVVVIAIIGYIASNILRELNELRDHYTSTNKGFETIKGDLKNFKSNLEDANSNAKNLLKTFEDIKIARSYTELVDDIKNVKNESGLITNSLENFSGSINDLMKSFNDKLTKIEFPDYWLISAIALHERRSSELFKDHNLIVTKFEVFGDILHTCINELIEKNIDKSKYELHTTIVLNPKSFIDYGNTPEEVHKWNNYLEANRRIAQTGIKLHRNFISLDTSCLDNKEATDNLENFVGNSNREIIDSLNDSHWDSNLSATSKRFPSKNIRDLILEHHVEGGAKKMTVRIDINTIGSLNSMIIDESTKKPIDYFAIRENGDWVFCFKAIFDNAHNICALYLYNPKMTKQEEWNKLREYLDKLFVNEIKPAGVAVTLINK